MCHLCQLCPGLCQAAHLCAVEEAWLLWYAGSAYPKLTKIHEWPKGFLAVSHDLLDLQSQPLFCSYRTFVSRGAALLRLCLTLPTQLFRSSPGRGGVLWERVCERL